MRPSITITAEELDKLMLHLAEAPAKFSFDVIAVLMNKRQEAEAARAAAQLEE